MSRLIQSVARSPALRTTTSSCSACQKRYSHKLVEIELIQDVPNLGFRGDRLPISPGRARNVLIPGRQALYVGRNGKAVSPLRDMIRKERTLEEKRAVEGEMRLHKLAKQREAEVLEAEQDYEDPQALAYEADRLIYSSLSLLDPLLFPRRLIHPTSSAATEPTNKEIFGSVSVHDVMTQLKESGIMIEEANGAFKEGEGVEKGRIKAVGDYTFLVSLKAMEDVVEVPVQVVKEA